jgi:transposase InsO family protein
MQALYYAARGNLRWLLRLHPEWSQSQLAHALGMSRSWVGKWIKRLKSAPASDEEVLRGLSRAPKHPPERLDTQVVDRILQMRDEPPEGLGRTPGPKAILYYLPRDENLQQAALRLPRSTRTIHRILQEHGRICHRLPALTDPQERPEPMQQWQLDFKDASTVPADAEGKQQHVVETLNIIDVGTSVLLAAHVAPDFTAQTALSALAETFQQHGLPHAIRLDRDPRWVGAPQGSDFPSALLRFCSSLGVVVLVCDPHHPQQNGYVERYHRSYGQECLDRHRPRTLQEVREVTETFVEHYNWQCMASQHRQQVCFPTSWPQGVSLPLR